MDIQGVGTGPVDEGPSSITRGVPLTKDPEALAQSLVQIDADTIAGLLSELSPSQITPLLNIIEPELLPHQIAQFDSLVRDASLAAATGDVKGVLEKLSALALLDPSRAEALVYDPALAPMRKDVDAVLARFTSLARLNADALLQDASRMVQDSGVAARPIRDVEPGTLLLLAGRLMEAGGFANCVRSAEVSQMVLDQYRWAPIAPPLPSRDGARVRIRRASAGIRRKMMATRLKNLWRRAPLLVLLLGWLAVGLVGGSIAALFRDESPTSISGLFFEIWALGFLALILFGFYMRLRNR